jgi:hypothetical protein
VSPQESFSCSLGVDPAVRVTYHPLMKKHKTLGTWPAARSESVLHTRRITIKNTRETALRLLTLKDQIPLSADDQIKINLIEPGSLNASSNKGTVRGAALDRGVSVRWAQVNEDGTGGDAENGIVEWLCQIGAGASISAMLIWEVIAPLNFEWAQE